jgi:hypothetical protein
MMSPKEITNRFPDLKVGEVIYICSGVVFNRGTEEERSRFARRYCERMRCDAPEKVVGVALETEEAEEDETTSAPKKRNSKKL